MSPQARGPGPSNDEEHCCDGMRRRLAWDCPGESEDGRWLEG